MLLLAAACSTPQLSYNRLDWLASWQLSKYVSLNDGQQQRFDADFDALWIWHRDLELMRYAADLRELSEAVRLPLTVAAIGVWAKRIDAHWERLSAKLAPGACAHMATLTNPQVASVLRRVDRNIAERTEELVAPPEAQVRKESQQRLLKSLRHWLGKLDSVQLTDVARWSAERELTYTAWLDQRRLWRERFAETLARRSTPGFCGDLEQLFARPQASTGADGQLLTRYDGNRAGWTDFVARLSSTLSPSQRQHLQAELLTLAEDFEALAAKTSG